MKLGNIEIDLKTLISQNESEILEFKERFDNETIETVVALANAKGGIILIGVSDNNELKGVTVGRETLKDWTNRISQTTEPTIIPEIDKCEMAGKTIVAIIVKEAPLKPIAYKGVCLLRVKNSNKKLTPKKISELYLQTIASSWDSYIVRNTTIEEINNDKVRQYIDFANKTGRRKISEAPLEVLKKLELIRDNKPTWASILLFGRNPQGSLPQSKIHCGRFKNEVTIIDDELLDGNIIGQVDKAMGFIKKHLKLEFKITGEARRKEIWEYPLEAVREAIVNAVCHRDYTEASDVQIRTYDDKLIIWNPGKLPSGITIEDLYKPHKSVPRNKLIAQVFFDIGLIEKWGTGIERMVRACMIQGLPKPKFEEYQGFRVVFMKDIYSEEYLRDLGLNERQIRAVMYLKEKGRITNKDYQVLNKISRETSKIELNALVDKKIIVKIGKGRGVHYHLG